MLCGNINALWQGSLNNYPIFVFTNSREVIVFLPSNAKSILNEHRENQCTRHRSLCFKAKQMRHDTALFEMILTCRLLLGNWSDLHANGLRLWNDVGGSGSIAWGDVHRLFCASLSFDFSACEEWNQCAEFIHIWHTVFCKWLCFQ